MKMMSFTPIPGSTQSIAATGAITGLSAIAEDLCLTNVGTQLLFVRVTTAADVSLATVADYPVPPNTQVVIGKSGQVRLGMTRLAVFMAAAGSTLYVTPGEGV